MPELRWLILAGVVVAAVMIVASGAQRFHRLAAVALILGSIAGLCGTAAYAIATSATSHTGSIPTAGPSGAVTASGFGGGGTRPTGGTPPAGVATGGTPPAGTSANAGAGASAGGAGGGGAGGGEDAASNEALDTLLESAGTTWSAAVNGSQSAATYELDTNTAVMAIGGWSSDPAPSLDQFISYVSNDQVHYYISGGQGGGGNSTDSNASAIEAWVTAHFTATTVGSSTVYDLSGYTG